MQKLGALILVLLAATSGAQDIPPEPDRSELIDPQGEMARLGSPTGTWEGWVEPIYDMAGVNRGRREGEREGHKIRLIIRIQSAEIFTTEADGQERRFEGDTYVYEVDNTVLISYVLANGAFVEYQSIALAQVEPDKLKGSVSRLVHNLVVRNSSPWRLVPNYGVVTLDRVK